MGRSMRQHLGAGVDPLGVGAVGHDPLQHPLGGPLDGGDGGDAEAFEDLGPAGVVDAGDHALHAERLPGHPGHEDVGVVAVGHRRQGAGLLDAGLGEPVPVEAHAGDGSAAEVLGQPFEGPDPAIDHRHGVPALLQGAGQPGPDAPATDNHYVHRVFTSVRVSREGTAVEPMPASDVGATGGTGVRNMSGT
jgi:hypothetical protein